MPIARGPQATFFRRGRLPSSIFWTTGIQATSFANRFPQLPIALTIAAETFRGVAMPVANAAGVEEAKGSAYGGSLGPAWAALSLIPVCVCRSGFDQRNFN